MYGGYFPNGYPSVPRQAGVATTMTPPVIHAEIVQVENETAAANYPVAAGSSQMMMARDDSAVFIKAVYPSGQFDLTVFEKRPPAPPAPAVDMGNYVTWAGLEEWISKRMSTQSAADGGVEGAKG